MTHQAGEVPIALEGFKPKAYPARHDPVPMAHAVANGPQIALRSQQIGRWLFVQE